MAKLSKANTYAVLWLNSHGKSVSDIVLDLSLTEKQVTSVLEKASRAGGEQANIKTAKSPATNSRSMNLMIRETAGKKNNTVSIMTSEASMVNDQMKNQSTNQQGKTDKYIFRPKK